MFLLIVSQGDGELHQGVETGHIQSARHPGQLAGAERSMRPETCNAVLISGLHKQLWQRVYPTASIGLPVKTFITTKYKVSALKCSEGNKRWTQTIFTLVRPNGRMFSPAVFMCIWTWHHGDECSGRLSVTFPLKGPGHPLYEFRSITSSAVQTVRSVKPALHCWIRKTCVEGNVSAPSLDRAPCGEGLIGGKHSAVEPGWKRRQGVITLAAFPAGSWYTVQTFDYKPNYVVVGTECTADKRSQ